MKIKTQIRGFGRPVTEVTNYSTEWTRRFFAKTVPPLNEDKHTLVLVTNNEKSENQMTEISCRLYLTVWTVFDEIIHRLI